MKRRPTFFCGVNAVAVVSRVTLLDGWMDGCVDGWMDGWIWVDGWVDG